MTTPYTQVPNILFDKHLPTLTLAELRLLLIIIRQTNGWIDPKTKKRKTRDRITHSQFVLKSGLTRQTVSSTLDTLAIQGCIVITDFQGNQLTKASERQGKSHLYYALSNLQLVRLGNRTCKVNLPLPVGLAVHNKRKETKEKRTKGLTSIKAILKNLYR